mmetsp:Transcript_21944/g.21678  ORF Transcript_21944/g.21678 Transcript_21944/m.21678 type:complete len:149 (-) Transcript_21944:164-610(-)
MKRSTKIIRYKAIDKMEPLHRPDTPPETKKHLKWASQVLKDHQTTSAAAQKMIMSANKTKRRMTHEIKEARRVISRWDDYNTDLQKACTALNTRRIFADEKSKEHRAKLHDERVRRLHYTSPTKCSIVKRQPKYAPIVTKIPKSFNVY